MTARQKVILDTDIGDDIDDALALGVILASPELELLGVTTVFGNTIARARQARSILAISGRRGLPVAVGCGAMLTTRAGPVDGRTAYLSGLLPNQDATCLPESALWPVESRHGVEFLIDTIMAGAGDIIPITIGAMTNLAMALAKEPRLAARIPRIVAMAGEVRRLMPEWNIRCDPEAAAIVFSSGIPIDVTTWHIGDSAKLTLQDLDRLRVSPLPLAHQLSVTIDAWRSATGHLPSLYDPVAVATMIRPDLCTWRRGTVQVELRGEHTFGMTTFADQEGSGSAATAPASPHRVAWDVDRDAAVAFILDRILQCSPGRDGGTMTA